MFRHGVFTEGLGMAEQENRGHFWIYVWLGVSTLLNLSGMASIIDGFVVWAKFFHDIIDIYRAVIRQPLAWIGHLIWPFGPIPGWVFDGIVIWATLALAINISEYRIMSGKTIPGEARKDIINNIADRILSSMRIALFVPLYIIIIPAAFFMATGVIPQGAVRKHRLSIIFLSSILLLTSIVLFLFATAAYLFSFVGSSEAVILAIIALLTFFITASAAIMSERESIVDRYGNWARNVLQNFLFLVAFFALLLFINWQIRQHGG